MAYQSILQESEAAMRVLNVLFTDGSSSDCSKQVGRTEYELDENGQMSVSGRKRQWLRYWLAAAKHMAYWPNVTLCKTWNMKPGKIFMIPDEEEK